jgi:hypothetical protein
MWEYGGDSAGETQEETALDSDNYSFLTTSSFSTLYFIFTIFWGSCNTALANSAYTVLVAVVKQTQGYA